MITFVDGAGTDMSLKPYLNATDWLVELLCGTEKEERAKIPDIVNSDRLTAR